MNIMPDVVDAQLRLQFLGRDMMLPSVMASDPAHDPNALPVTVEASGGRVTQCQWHWRASGGAHREDADVFRIVVCS